MDHPEQIFLDPGSVEAAWFRKPEAGDTIYIRADVVAAQIAEAVMAERERIRGGNGLCECGRATIAECNAAWEAPDQHCHIYSLEAAQ